MHITLGVIDDKWIIQMRFLLPLSQKSGDVTAERAGVGREIRIFRAENVSFLYITVRVQLFHCV